MVIFLYGSDKYRLLQNRDMVVQKFKDKHGAISIQSVDGSVPDAPAKFKASLANSSFFNDIQLVVVSDIFANPTTAGKIAELLEQYDALNDKQRIVVALHGAGKSAAKSPELWKLLADSKNLGHEFEPLDGIQFENWLKKEAQARGASFSAGAVRQLATLTGGDSWRAINELDKLSNYVRGPASAIGSGEAKPITVQHVNELVVSDAESKSFAFTDALGARDRARAFKLLHHELARGEEVHRILGLVAYQFRTMLMVQDAWSRSKNSNTVAKELGLKPFVVSKTISALSRYTPEALKEKYQAICDLELGAKQGTKDLQDSLYQFALML